MNVMQPTGYSQLIGQTTCVSNTTAGYDGYYTTTIPYSMGTISTSANFGGFDTIRLQPYLYQEEFIQANYIIVLYDRLKKYLAEGKTRYVVMIEKTIDLLREGRHGGRSDAQSLLAGLFASIDMDECQIETEKMKKRVNEVIPEKLLVWEDENSE